ncbi:MAG: CotH kinase family protein [Bauldia sp.]
MSLKIGLGAVAVLGFTALLVPPPALAQNARLLIQKQFDLNKNGLLEAAERPAAIAYMATLPPRSRFGPRFGGAGAVAAGSPGITLTPADVPSLAGTPLYDNPGIRTLFVTFDTANWEAEMAGFFNTDIYMPATVTVDGVVNRDVGVRFRGNSSFMSIAEGLKRPIQLRFDTVNAGQNVERYRTLNLLNSFNDPTFMRTYLYARISGAYLPTPQVGFVRLVLNGENWGIYANQQQFNNDFAEDFFRVRAGVRWDVPGSPNGRGGMAYLGEDIDQYRSVYEIDNQDRPESWRALINLFKVITETPLDRLEAALEPILDVDGVLKFLAVDVALVNSDGYWTRASDYGIYLHPDGRFHLIAHDINEALGASGSRNTRLDPLVGLNDPSKPLRSRLLAVPALRKRYLGHVLEIAGNWLDWQKVGPLLRERYAAIDADMRRDTRKLFTYEAFAAGLESDAFSLKSFMDERRAYLLAEVPRLLAAP